MHRKLNSVCPLKKSEIGSGKIGNWPIIKIKRSESDRDTKNVIGTSLVVISPTRSGMGGPEQIKPSGLFQI